MNFHAPTYKSLNKSQKRAFILRDSLRFLDDGHLDDFIEGVSHDEPPAYRVVNGTVQPPLVLVTLRNIATRFDLGNVHFDHEEDGSTGAIYRAYLTVEDGRFELRTEKELPADETNLDSVPIHIFIAKTMVPLFEAKFRAIHGRMTKINEIRQLAFSITNQPMAKFEEGDVCLAHNSTSSMHTLESTLLTCNRHFLGLDTSKLEISPVLL
jgi:hypothetical protein